MHRITALTAAAALITSAATVLAHEDLSKPVITTETKIEKDAKGKEKKILYMWIDGIKVHETDVEKQPLPPVVTPGAKLGDAPSDAVVLFAGTEACMANWTDTKGGKTKWIMKDSTLQPTKHSGYVRTKDEFGSCQLHMEFATPKDVKGSSQGRGNSGVFVPGGYEVQVLDSFENVTYADGQAGALYGRAKPLVNSSRGPGEWQSYDIIYHRPLFEDGKVVRRATFTVLHNGVLIQDHVRLSGATGWAGPHAASEYKPHADKGPIMLQDHGNPVLFRNIWIRELAD